MKKITAFTMALLMVIFCFAGCGSKESNQEETTDKAKTTIVVEGKFFEYTGMSDVDLLNKLKTYDESVSANENEDGSATYKIDYDAYTKYTDSLRAEKREAIEELEDKYNFVDDIECGNNLITMNVKVDADEYKNAKKSDVNALTEEIGKNAVAFQYINFEIAEKCAKVNYVDEDTDKVLDAQEYK
ncbi:MAG: hypothetical protein ACI4QE_03640 [Acutalibacteraceae bacterium]